MTLRTLAVRTGLLAAGLLTVAASPPHSTLISYTMPVASNVAPPAPPLPQVPPGFTPAPVPNVDLQFSGDRKAASSEPSLSPTVFHQGPTYLGEGYTPYSTQPGNDAPIKRLVPVGGLNLSVPLQ